MANDQPKPPTRAKRPRTYVVDMQHYLVGGALWCAGRAPAPAVKLGAWFGSVVAAASLHGASEAFHSRVPCRRSSGRPRCDQTLWIRLGETVDYECAGCGERGTISGWRDSPWDLGARLSRLRGLPPSERARLELSGAQKKALENSIGLHGRALSALLAAVPLGGRWFIDASRDEVGDLAVAASASLIDGEGSGVDACERVEEACHQLLGLPVQDRSAAQTADILCYRFLSERGRIRSVPRDPSAGVHRLSVELADVTPRVRRVLVVRSDTTLEELHALLQSAFGWNLSHLHVFEAGSRRYSRPDYEIDRAEPSHAATLASVAGSVGAELVYEYDFGDGWRHHIRVVAVLQREPAGANPRCELGENAAPPDDCGGPPGYEELVAALADPRHERHRELRAWIGRPFDPRHFDLLATNLLLRQLGRWMV